MSARRLALSDQEAQVCASVFGLQVWWRPGKWSARLVSRLRRNTDGAP